MQSKTSFFNKTIFRKNLTRFAPVWGVYTLCLVLGILLLYSNDGTAKEFHFANNILTELFPVLAMVNLGYGLLVAQLLFGDLYNNRMCNMLHAFPLSRESWFFTNVLSGFVFSLVPTLVMAVMSLPLLMGSLFEGAPALSWWMFLASNLQFVCFFGMAAFSAMCVGNRFTMAAGYGLLNAGAYIAYWLIDTVYTPMLYGVITPTILVENLTPLSHMVNHRFVKTEDNLYALKQTFGDKLEGAAASFTVTNEWWRLWLLAAVGIGFLLLAMALYRKRDLECAGDAVAFRWLVPVFQVLCAVFVATAAQFFLCQFFNLAAGNFLVLAAGLVVGWFVGKMLLERTTRVFRLKNFYGLAALAAVFAVSLWMTHVDILGIETRLPAQEDIKSVFFESDWTVGTDLTDADQIADMLRLNELALEKRAEDSGTYGLNADGEWTRDIDDGHGVVEGEGDAQRYAYVAEIGLTYELESGKTIRRRYNVWTESPAGEIAREYLSSWEHVNHRYVEIEGQKTDRLTLAMEDFKSFYVDYAGDGEMPEIFKNKEAAESLLRAIQADCEAGTMAQHPFFHNGHFRYENERAEKGYSNTESISIDIEGERYSWYLSIYPDSENTIRWLENNGLLNVEVRPEKIHLW